MRAARALLNPIALCLVASTSLGCWAVAKRDADLDRAPVVNTGAGATVIYPGQTAPPHPGNFHPREAGYGQNLPRGATAPQAPAPTGGAAHLPPDAVAAGVAQPPPEYASRSGSRSGSGSGSGGGSGITMLGGAEQEIERHISINEEPMWMKYAVLPFAVAAAPFKYGYDKIRGEAEPGPAVPRIGSQPHPELDPQPQYRDTGTVRPSAPAGGHRAGAPQATALPENYETARLQGLERELAQRSAAAPPVVAAPPPQSGAGSSIADELALLRQRAARPTTPTPAPRTAALPRTRPESAAPDTPGGFAVTAPGPQDPVGQVDRDGDGRTDHWIERRDGAIVAERFDDDFDSRPDRTLIYDPATREVIRIEEDTDHDGRLDSWTSLRAGQVSGRRVDGNGDGQVDSWSHYKGGTITRLERDADGDGFRDLVAYYRDGRLDREERDDDADGLTDLVRYYDDGERVERVEEDADGDGEMDVVSHYESGRLTRREVLDASVLETP